MADVEIRPSSDDDWTTIRPLRMLALRRDPRAFDDEAVEAARTEAGCADGDWRLGPLWVSPPYRGRGVTALLLSTVEPWAAATGCRQLILGVTEDDPAVEL